MERWEKLRPQNSKVEVLGMNESVQKNWLLYDKKSFTFRLCSHEKSPGHFLGSTIVHITNIGYRTSLIVVESVKHWNAIYSNCYIYLFYVSFIGNKT